MRVIVTQFFFAYYIKKYYQIPTLLHKKIVSTKQNDRLVFQIFRISTFHVAQIFLNVVCKNFVQTLRYVTLQVGLHCIKVNFVTVY